MVVSNLLFYETNFCKSLKLSVLIVSKCSQLFTDQQNLSPLHDKLFMLSALMKLSCSQTEKNSREGVQSLINFPCQIRRHFYFVRSPRTVVFEKDQSGQQLITHAGSARPHDDTPSPPVTKHLLNCCTQRRDT